MKKQGGVAALSGWKRKENWLLAGPGIGMGRSVDNLVYYNHSILSLPHYSSLITLTLLLHSGRGDKKEWPKDKTIRGYEKEQGIKKLEDALVFLILVWNPPRLDLESRIQV